MPHGQKATKKRKNTYKNRSPRHQKSHKFKKLVQKSSRHRECAVFQRFPRTANDVQISAAQTLYEHHRDRADTWSQVLSSDLYLLPPECDKLLHDTTNFSGIPIWNVADATVKEICTTEKASIDDALIRNVFHEVEQ